MVEQRPAARPLQRVVDQVLDPAPPDVVPLGGSAVVQGGLGQQPDADALGAALVVVPARLHQQQGAILVRPAGARFQRVPGDPAGALLLLPRAASDGPGPEPHGQRWVPAGGCMPSSGRLGPQPRVI